jgi:copper homeostasis protein CutC
MRLLDNKIVLEVFFPLSSNLIVTAEEIAELRELMKSPHFVQLELARGDGAHTPTSDQVKMVWDILQESTNPPALNVMVNPEGGEDFKYTPKQIKEMTSFIEAHNGLADGYVVGILTSSSTLYKQPMSDFARAAFVRSTGETKPITIHGAYDLIPESKEIDTLDYLEGIEVHAILTAGGPEGRFHDPAARARILKSQRLANSRGIRTLARGGITADQIMNDSDPATQSDLFSLARHGGGVHARFNSESSGKRPSLEVLNKVGGYLQSKGFKIVSNLREAAP